LERFLAFLYIKAVWGIEGKTGLRISNRTQFHILPPKGRSVALQSAINCIKEHPMLSQQPYYDSSSGAKVPLGFAACPSKNFILKQPNAIHNF